MEDITNEYYAPEFAEYITFEYMPFIPLCGSLMLDLVDKEVSRVSNAYVEAHNKIVKVDILNKQKKNSMGQTVRKLKDYVKTLVAEANIGSSAHTKSKVNVPRKSRYPDTASNPFVKDVWRRGIPSSKRRESHFKGKEIRRIVQDVIESKMKQKEESEEEVKVSKVLRVPKAQKVR